MNPPSVIAQPTVSIGLPVYNGGRYLRQALDSLLAQTHKDFELIIGDNASTDETEAICLEYAARDSRIRYFRHHENLGAVRNFLFVFEKTRGWFFMWAAHDDLWDRDWIEKMLATASAESGVMAYGHVCTIDSAGMPMEHPANGRSFRFDQRSAWLRRLMYFLQYEGLGKANPIYGLYRLSDVGRGLAALRSQSQYADCLFLFDVLARIKLKSVSHVFHYKRVHPASTACAISDRASTTRRLHPWLVKIKNVLRSVFLAEAAIGYITHSFRTERFVMLAATPVKAVFLCYGLFLRHASNRRAAQIKTAAGRGGSSR